jgi:hypothetical protein
LLKKIYDQRGKTQSQIAYVNLNHVAACLLSFFSRHAGQHCIGTVERSTTFKTQSPSLLPLGLDSQARWPILTLEIEIATSYTPHWYGGTLSRRHGPTNARRRLLVYYVVCKMFTMLCPHTPKLRDPPSIHAHNIHRFLMHQTRSKLDRCEMLALETQYV